jgi:hypothetical protein
MCAVIVTVHGGEKGNQPAVFTIEGGLPSAENVAPAAKSRIFNNAFLAPEVKNWHPDTPAVV